MAFTEYTIQWHDSTWRTTDTEAADYWRQRGADVSAETTHQGCSGIPMQRLSDAELQALHNLAQARDWKHVSHMLGNWRQKQVTEQ